LQKDKRNPEYGTTCKNIGGTQTGLVGRSEVNETNRGDRKMKKAKKITKATFKSFIRKNQGTLYIKCMSSFDGMTDCVEYDNKAGFEKVTENDSCHGNTLGISGVWLVGGSRNWFKKYEDAEYEGIEVSNCCGSFILAVKIK